MISSLPTIARAAEQIRAGEISPLDLVDFCLAKIEQHENRIQAWVFIDSEGARETARKQAELFRQNIDPGPLAGIPIAIKDIVDVAGWPTKAGSPLREQHVAVADAPLVSLLREAGAIILGKTVTTQFACFDPPPTRNPWNTNHTPGGSSSGSAAAVSLEMCMAAIGSQTGGSIIRPASYCGVAGFKPTFGQVSLDGVVPVSKHLDHVGPIARSVRDLAAVYAVISNTETPTSLQLGGSSPRSLGLFEEFFFDEATSAVTVVTREAISKLQDAWSEERTLRLPASFQEVPANHYRVMAFDAAGVHRSDYESHPDSFGPNISTLIDAGLSTSREDYLVALEFQKLFQIEMDELLADDLVAVMPSTSTTAPASLETTGDPKFNSPWSYAGVPSITIPCGIAADGMPCGLQLIGRRGSDANLLRVAAWCEDRLKFVSCPV